MPAIPELRDELSDGRVSLRLAAERDIPEILIAYQDDPQMHLRLGEERPPSGAQLGRGSERAPAELAAGTAVTLTILEPGSDQCQGQVVVREIDWENQRAEVQLWVAPQDRGRGFGRSALRLAATWLLGTCGLERIELLTEPDNRALIAAATAAGFTHEGVLRSYMRVRRDRHDAAILSLIAEDLRA